MTRNMKVAAAFGAAMLLLRLLMSRIERVTEPDAAAREWQLSPCRTVRAFAVPALIAWALLRAATGRA